MRRRSIDEILAECEARGPESCELAVEHIRSEYPGISDQEIAAVLEGAIERSMKHDLAMLAEDNAQHPEGAFSAEDLAAIAPDLVRPSGLASGPHRKDAGETGAPR